MSLTKLLKAPIKLFKKEVITFVIIRRYDLGNIEDKFRFISVKPSTSITSLRHKIWYLLDLPDFCEEIIVLKSDTDVVLPLTDLRKGNDPQHPYVMEVYLPGPRNQSNTGLHNKLLTIENGVESSSDNDQAVMKIPHHIRTDDKCPCNSCKSHSIISNETVSLNKVRFRANKTHVSHMLSDFKKSDLSCRLSCSSLFRLHGRKNSDNFTQVLMKMQSDLSTLTNKLSSLENRILS